MGVGCTVMLTWSISIVKSQWIKSSTSLSSADSVQAIGTYNSSIYLIGGYNNRRKLIEYVINADLFNDHGDYSNDDIYGYSQYYTQTDHILYMKLMDQAHISIFDMKTKTYTASYILNQDISSKLRSPCLASTSQDLFIIGGSNGYYIRVDTVRVYNFLSEQWLSNVPTMQEVRSEHSCVIHPTTNILYVFGGSDDNGMLRSVEIIDTDDITQQSWSYIVQLSKALAFTRAVIYPDYDIIYVIGGGVGNSPYYAFDIVHIVDTSTNTISVSPYTLGASIMDTATIIVDHTVYVFGGWNDVVDSELDTLMTYVLPTNEPSAASTTMPITQSTTLTESTTTNKPTTAPTTNTISLSTAITDSTTNLMTTLTTDTMESTTTEASQTATSSPDPLDTLSTANHITNNTAKPETTISTESVVNDSYVTSSNRSTLMTETADNNESILYIGVIAFNTTLKWKEDINVNDNTDRYATQLVFVVIGTLIAVCSFIIILIVCIVCCCEKQENGRYNINIKHLSIHKLAIGAKDGNNHHSVSLENVKTEHSETKQKRTGTMTNNQTIDGTDFFNTNFHPQNRLSLVDGGKPTVEGLQGNDAIMMANINKHIQDLSGAGRQQHIIHNFLNEGDKEVIGDATQNSVDSVQLSAVVPQNTSTVELPMVTGSMVERMNRANALF